MCQGFDLEAETRAGFILLSHFRSGCRLPVVNTGYGYCTNIPSWHETAFCLAFLDRTCRGGHCLIILLPSPPPFIVSVILYTTVILMMALNALFRYGRTSPISFPAGLHWRDPFYGIG